MAEDPLAQMLQMGQQFVNPAENMGFLKRTFLKPDGGINWRTILLGGAGAAAGLFLGGEAMVAGALLGAGAGLAGGAAWEYFSPSQAAAPVNPVAGAPSGGQGPQPPSGPEIVPPRTPPGFPPRTGISPPPR